MILSIALVPVLSLLFLVATYITIASLRSSRIAVLRTEHDQFTQSVLHQDAALQASLLGELMEGKPLAECLDGFQRRRAALLPAVRLDDPAGWDTQDLERHARQRLAEGVSVVNRRLGAAAALAAVCVIGLCALVTAVLYGFQPAVGGTVPPSWSTPANEPAVLPGFDPLNIPPSNPPPLYPEPPSPVPAPPAPVLPAGPNPLDRMT